ncbi:MAG: hypothetical protein J0M16_06825 [Gammaproteobacteria bacterium]|nr:hypothetical protein [Gammaproteobacteria bacterium]
MELLPLVKGVLTWVPLAYDARRGHTGGTGSARYCYSVWMRHLVAIRSAGIGTSFDAIAELGPGDSLGIGLTGLLAGARRLEALDVVPYTSSPANIPLVGELAALLAARAPIPGPEEFPGVVPLLGDYAFPARLVGAIDADELARRRRTIEAALAGRSAGLSIRYQVPWDALETVVAEPVDLLYSQAVLEHVESPGDTYRAMSRWVVPGGVVSHVIDLRSHCLTPGWDGHLQYPPRLWRLVKGARPYLLNRWPASAHRQCLEANGFRVVREDRILREPTLDPRSLPSPFRDWSAEDRRTASVHYVAVRT